MSSKYKVIDLWNERYGKCEEITDYTGVTMYKSACGNPNSSYEPTIDHIRPLSKGGKDIKENIVICHRDINFEKGDDYPHWNVNGKKFRAEKVKGKSGAYIICEDY